MKKAEAPKLFVVQTAPFLSLCWRGIYQAYQDTEVVRGEEGKPVRDAAGNALRVPVTRYILARIAIVYRDGVLPTPESDAGLYWRTVRRGTKTGDLKRFIDELPADARPYDGKTLPRLGYKGVDKNRADAQARAAKKATAAA